MRLIDRYIGKSLIQATLLALLVLLAVDVLFVFINEVQDIGKGSYSLLNVLAYIALSLPGSAIDVFAMAALLGTLLGLGTLAGHSELTGMRAAGVSILRIVRSALQAGALMLVVVAVAGEWITPYTDQLAQEKRNFAQSDQVSFKSRHGFWARDGNRFVNLRQILPDGRFAGISVYTLDDRLRLTTLLEAEAAQLSGDEWILDDVSRSEFLDDQYTMETSPRMVVTSVMNPELINLVLTSADNLSVRDLYRYIRYLKANNLDASPYQLAFWRRLGMPLSTLVMVLLAIPFVFGPLRSARTGQRLLVGVLVGIGYFLAERTLSHVGQVYGFAPVISALAAPLMVFAVSLFFLRSLR